jgi:hypothetical protein
MGGFFASLRMTADREHFPQQKLERACRLVFVWLIGREMPCACLLQEARRKTSVFIGDEQIVQFDQRRVELFPPGITGAR